MKAIEFSFKVGDRVISDSGEVQWRNAYNDWPYLVSFGKDEDAAIEEAVMMFRDRLTHALRMRHPQDFVWTIKPPA